MDWKYAEDHYSSGIYSKQDIQLVRGKGSRVWDGDVKEYLDCAGGIGVASVGHCNDRIISDLKDQLEKLKRVDIHMEEKKREAIPQTEELKEKGNGKNSGR